MLTPFGKCKLATLVSKPPFWGVRWEGLLRATCAVALALTLALGFGQELWADDRSDGASLSGVVKDALGRPISGAYVELKDAQNKVVARATTDADGRFVLKGLAPGVFALSVQKQGFKPGLKVVRLEAGAARDVALSLEALKALTVPIRAALRRAQNGLSSTGANEYTMTSEDIRNLPEGEYTPLNEVLLQMPGVALDQNQEIHVRGEHMGLQYQMNGILLPLDINVDPTFEQLVNSFFVSRVSLIDGVLPARYGFHTAGVIDLETKDGCALKSGSFTIFGGQRETAEPSFELAGCHGPLSYYATGLFQHNNLGFSQATPGPDPIHDLMNQGQGFAYVKYELSPQTRLSLISGFTVDHMQFPNQVGLPPLYTLNGVDPANYPSQAINSALEQQDYFAVLALSGSLTPSLSYQLAYATHYFSQRFIPDPIGDLIYEGVASDVSISDLSNSLEGDFTYQLGASHTIGWGFYVGEYGVSTSQYSLTFPANSQGQQTSTTPIAVANSVYRLNMLYGIYLQDTYRITEKLSVNVGARFDLVRGFANGSQLSPTINFTYASSPDTVWHAGFARYFQVPNFQGIPPTTATLFANTTASTGVTTGISFAEPERDDVWDVGVMRHLTPYLTLTQDNYFRLDHHYLDEGNFGFVPISAPFNYDHGYGWGSEYALSYNIRDFSLRVNAFVAREEVTGVATGQFNFPPDELAYIDSHYIILDHTPLVGLSGGAACRWRRWQFTIDGLYSSGLRGGFANEEQLPQVWQVNVSGARSFFVPKVGWVEDRVVLINIFNRTNLIRPPTGIGVFQAAYGPRIAVYDALTVPLPLL